MLVGVDLGVALLLLLLTLLIRRRWQREAARKEEVRRLMLLAAVEEERAEREAVFLFSAPPAAPAFPAPAPRPAAAPVAKAPPPPPPLVCASCSSPATARCARCKAVRYCSGKCQIIHWRQGHKDECYPPSVNVEHAFEELRPWLNPSGLTHDSVLKNEETKQSWLNKNNVAPEELLNVKATGGLSEGAEVATSHNALGRAPRDKTSIDASLKEKDSGTGVNASVYEGLAPSPVRATSESSDSSSSSVRISVDIGGDKSAKDPISLVSTGVSEEKTVHPSHLKNKRSVFSTEDDHPLDHFSMPVDHIYRQQSKTGGQNLVSDQTSKLHGSVGVISSDFEAKMSTSSTVSECKSQLEHTEKLAFGTNNSDPVAVGSMNDMLRNKKILRSSSASGSNQFSSDGGHPNVFHKSSDVASVSIRSTSIGSSAQNGLTSYMNQVVTQLPASKNSRSYSSELMLFPYELFIKLCNEKVGYQPCGLTNCGNSCYANVVLQCLLFTHPLTTYLFEGLHSKTCPKKEWCFTCELERLFVSSKQGRSPLSPIGILSHLEDIGSSFSRGKQEDAHEFLRYAVEAMQSVCLKETGAKPGESLAEETTLIQQTFGGYLKSKIKCGRCKCKSEQSERMMDLAVEIDGNIDSIEEALKRFTSTETLDGENKYKCSRCKSYERAHKSLTISEAPNFLTITLKRFQSGKFGKLNKVVRFDRLLNLAPYMHETDDSTPIYGLYAVVVHIDVMNSTSSGHYVCYVKDTQGKWFEIDDSKVKPVDLDKVLAMKAYILFYARYSPRAPRSVRKARAYVPKVVNRIRSKEIKPNLESPQSSPSGSMSPNQLHRINAYDPANSRTSLPFEEVDSDSSSLFSCSDEGSSSTDSAKESTASDESSSSPLRASERSLDGTIDSLWSSRQSSDTFYNGYVSGSYSSSDSYLSTSSSGRGGDKMEAAGRINYTQPRDTRGAGFEGKGGSPSFLYPDDTKQFRHLTGNYRTRETNWINASEAKPGASLRRPTR